MLWIRIGFSWDLESDPALYLNADPDTDPDPGSQSIRIWVLVLRLLSGKKLSFYMENIFKVGTVIVQKPCIRTDISLFEWHKTRYICQFWSTSMLLDPDPHSRIQDNQMNAESRIQVDPDPLHWFFRLLHPISGLTIFSN